jgi:two-component system cell cycle response regulator DivK
MSLILIVEDNDKNMKLARDVLQAKGYRTAEAVTGEDAVRLAAELQPDTILMDIQLPGMSGLEAIKALRKDAKTSEIPVIAITASVMDQDRANIITAGFDAYIAKPISLKNFLETVRRMVEQGR